MSNRKIKFRAWSIHQKRWESKLCLYLDDSSLGDVSECFHNRESNDDYVIQQYTGLKDKNGKEIYEGDIISIDEVERGPLGTERLLQHFDVAVVEWNNTILSYVYSIPRNNSKPLTHQMLTFGKNATIIGNIFETRI